MLAVKILKHSIRQVFDNLGAALRISALIYAVDVVMKLTLIGPMFYDQKALGRSFISSTFRWGNVTLTMAIAVLAGLWIAVGWHRFILRSEEPGAVLPAFHGRRILAYCRGHERGPKGGHSGCEGGGESLPREEAQL